MSALPDEYQTASLVNGLATAIFASRPYHRNITNIVVGSSVAASVKCYRGSLSSVPVAQNAIGSNTVSGKIAVPAGQVFYVQWSAAGSPVSSAFARVSADRVDDPLVDDSSAAQTWAINALRSLTIGGLDPGTTRMVIGEDLPPPLSTYLFSGSVKASAAIIFHFATASDDNYSFLAMVRFPGTLTISMGHVLAGVMLEESSGHPAGQEWRFNGSGDVTSVLAFPPSGTPSNGLFIGAPIAAAPIRALSGPASSGSAETWHALTLLNSWADQGSPYAAAQYRLVPSPANEVEVVFALTGSNKADGTNIANLPAGYRPSSRTTRPVYTSATVAGGQSPAVNVETNGNIQIFGHTTAAGVGFINGHFFVPLDA